MNAILENLSNLMKGRTIYLVYQSGTTGDFIDSAWITKESAEKRLSYLKKTNRYGWINECDLEPEWLI